jgi:hypothetical protein
MTTGVGERTRSARAAFRAMLVVVALLGAARAGAEPASAEPPRSVQPERPPAPVGVEDLELRELFAPIGRRGPEYSEKARRLAGKRVRVQGYMVEQDRPLPGRFLLAPLPLRLHEQEYGHADDLPASTLFVVTPDDADRVLPHTPGPLLLTGTLELAPRSEADGRVSTARLVVRDPARASDNPTHEE